MCQQQSNFSIDACEFCGRFDRVAWYDIDGDERLTCDACLIHYDIHTQDNEKKHRKYKVIT